MFVNSCDAKWNKKVLDLVYMSFPMIMHRVDNLIQNISLKMHQKATIQLTPKINKMLNFKNYKNLNFTEMYFSNNLLQGNHYLYKNNNNFKLIFV